MKKRKLPGVFALAFVIMAARSPSAAAIEDRILAVVNDEVITLKDLKDYLTSLHTRLRLEGRDPGGFAEFFRAARKEGLQRLIEDRLILTEAEKTGLEVNEAAVEDRLKRIRRRFSSEEEFLDALTAEGTTLNELKDEIRDRLKIRFLTEHEVKSKIYVNPQDVTRFYEAHGEMFTEPLRARIRLIFIASDGDAQAARKRISDLHRRIESGEDFAALAEKYSQRPSPGIVRKGEMRPEMDRVVFSLEKGRVSEPVEGPDGFYLFEVEEFLPSRKVPLEECKNWISDHLFQEEFKRRFRAWIDELKSKAYIEIH